MRALEVVLLMSNLILPSKSGLWVPERTERGLVPAHEVRAFQARPALRRRGRVAGSGGSPLTLSWFSDWRNGTGTGQTALEDGSGGGKKWDLAEWQGPDSTKLVVQSASGLGFPAGLTNVLRVHYRANDEWANVHNANRWALPNIGQSVYFRAYFRFAIAGDAGGTHHPFQRCTGASACCSQTWWKFNRPPNGSDILFFVIESDPDLLSTDQHIWAMSSPAFPTLPRMSRYLTYRVEEQYERTGTLAFKHHFQIWDTNDTDLLLSNSDINCTGAGHADHLAGAASVNHASADCMRQLLIGTQGVGASRGNDDDNNNRMYYGAPAVAIGDPLGEEATWISRYPHTAEAA